MARGLTKKMSATLAAVAVLSGMASSSDRPLVEAAMQGNVEVVKQLLARGADVNEAQGDGMTALHWSAERGDVEIASLLLEAGANVRALTRIGSYTPLHLASKSGNGPIIEALLRAGADVNAVTSNSGATPLHFAAAAGDVRAVTALLDRGAQVNARDATEWEPTPLMFAAATNGADVIALLLARGADPDLATRAYDVPSRARVDLEAIRLQRQALRGVKSPTSEQVQASIRAGREAQRTLADADFKPTEDEYGRSVDEVAGIPTLVGSWGGMSALHLAAREGHVASAVALLDGGADIDQRSGDLSTPLLIATLNGQFDTALELIERGADPNLASHVDMTPLYAVIQTQWAPRSRFPQPRAQDSQTAEYLDVMEALLVAGADPDVRLETHLWYMEYTFNLLGVDLIGTTAFWRAAYAVDVEALELLAAYGADPNVPSIRPDVERGQAGEVQRGASPLQKERPDMSGLLEVPFGGPAIYPIHAATGVGYGEGRAANHHRTAPDGWLPTVQFLVDVMGADVNARDFMGYTPLHHAASRGDVEVIEFLVSRGADVKAIARSGETTADMANGPHPRGQVYPEALKLLESLGAKNQGWCAAGAIPSTCIRG
jgi:ankyrin repeat protein